MCTLSSVKHITKHVQNYEKVNYTILKRKLGTKLYDGANLKYIRKDIQYVNRLFEKWKVKISLKKMKTIN